MSDDDRLNTDPPRLPLRAERYDAAPSPPSLFRVDGPFLRLDEGALTPEHAPERFVSASLDISIPIPSEDPPMTDHGDRAAREWLSRR